MRGGHLRVGAFCGVGALLAAASCLAPTEVTLVLTTDVQCPLNGTSITVGSASEVETKDPVTQTQDCTPSTTGDNTIGTLVVVPSSGSSDAFAVRVVTGVTSLVTECTAANNYQGCIVARRDLAFLPHTPLTLLIAMRRDCLNVPCTAGQTCDYGICKSSKITNLASCVGAGCGDQSLTPLDSGSPDAEPLVDGASEAEPGDGLASGGDVESGAMPADSASFDSVAEAMSSDAPTVDASGMDATLVDAAGHDASSVVDAPADVASSPGPDASSNDAGAPDGLAPSDAGVLGSCIGAGTSSVGVSCGGGNCAEGEVCCVAMPTTGPVTETCTSSAACTLGTTGSPIYSSFACMNNGDCMAGTTCCLTSPAGTSYESTCAATCPMGFTAKILCRNTCECGGLACGEISCGGQPIGACGGGICP